MIVSADVRRVIIWRNVIRVSMCIGEYPMMTRCIVDAEKDLSMKNLSPKEAITILKDMRINIPVPKSAVTQIKKNLALDMAINALNCSEIPNNSDAVSRRQALDAVKRLQTYKLFEGDDMLLIDKGEVQTELMMLPHAQPYTTEEIQKMQELESAQLERAYELGRESAQPEKETPKRVLWNGWKGVRDTRYKCPNCKKPVRNTDIYCHRCGQKLMFPNIDFTPYVEGQKQELIVRWDDEE